MAWKNAYFISIHFNKRELTAERLLRAPVCASVFYKVAFQSIFFLVAVYVFICNVLTFTNLAGPAGISPWFFTLFLWTAGD